MLQQPEKNTKSNEQKFLKAESSMLLKRIANNQASEINFWKTRTSPRLSYMYPCAF